MIRINRHLRRQIIRSEPLGESGRSRVAKLAERVNALHMDYPALAQGTVEVMIRPAAVVGDTPIVGVSHNDSKAIGRILNVGAQGIQVLHIPNRQDAVVAVHASRYSAQGD